MLESGLEDFLEGLGDSYIWWVLRQAKIVPDKEKGDVHAFFSSGILKKIIWFFSKTDIRFIYFLQLRIKTSVGTDPTTIE